jgi:hypothetical protein
MKRIFLFILLLTGTGMLFAADYSNIDRHAATVPPNLRTANDIARYLTKNLTTPTDKARAIYYWISHAIVYDVTKMYSTETYTDPQELVDKALKTRRGVCSNYAALFQACCKSVGVQSYIIEGYTRQNDKVVGIAHAWNAVKINGVFYNIDATWASGFLKGNKYYQQFRDNYFMIPPAEFIKTHMPFDPIWQFLNNPVSHKEFEAGNFSNLKKESNYDYSDSIKVQSALSTWDKQARETQRIIASGLTNAMIRNKVMQNQQGIASDVFNKAADSFNKAVEKYNFYIQCKNKQFDNMSMKDDKILELLSSTRQLVESAGQTLAHIKSDNFDLNRSIDSMEKSIAGMKKNLDTEDAFAGKYVKTLKPLRLFLFYKKNE